MCDYSVFQSRDLNRIDIGSCRKEPKENEKYIFFNTLCAAKKEIEDFPDYLGLERGDYYGSIVWTIENFSVKSFRNLIVNFDKQNLSSRAIISSIVDSSKALLKMGLLRNRYLTKIRTTKDLIYVLNHWDVHFDELDPSSEDENLFMTPKQLYLKDIRRLRSID